MCLAFLLLVSCNDRTLEQEEYRVIFKLSGGTGDVPEQSVKYGEKAVKPSVEPVCKGFRFMGWTVKEYGTEPYDFNTPVTSDLFLYAIWENVYTVTFNLDGGAGNITDQIVKEGEKATKPSENPSRTGYDFVRWSTTKDGSEEYEYSFDRDVMEDLTIYAVWVRIYNVKFDTNGGEGKILIQEVRAGEKAVCPENKPTRECFSFDCWMKGDTRFDFNKDVITDDTTLTAKWKYNEYKIGQKGPAGGIICYDNKEEKTSYYIPLEGGKEVPYTWRYLERSEKPLEADSFSDEDDRHNTHYDIGCGRGNTYELLRAKGNFPAARKCYEYGKGTKYDDWFLPSIYELRAIWKNKTEDKSLSDGEYWSSSVEDDYPLSVWAWKISFPDDDPFYNEIIERRRFKHAFYAVRAF